MKLDHPLPYVWLAILIGVPPGLLAAARPPGEVIDSVLVREKDAFASTENGLYRALLSDKEWRRLDTPEAMPLGGEFADQPPDSKLVVYYPRNRGEKIHPGVYVSKNDGRTWRHGGGEHRFKHLFLHPNGTLYGIAVGFSERGEVLRSDDLGATWENMTHDIPRGMLLLDFSRHPDRPDDVILHGNLLRLYVLELDRNLQHWEMVAAGWWQRDRPTSDEQFLNRRYFTQTTLYMQQATLGNYFAFPFEGRTRRSALQIVPERLDYEFGREDDKRISVEVRFYHEGDQLRLADAADENVFWRARAILPDGTRTRGVASRNESIYDARDREKAREDALNAADLRMRELDHEHPYRRTINLDELLQFSQPGTYRLRLYYSNEYLLDRESGSWLGGFSSPVMTVRIVP